MCNLCPNGRELYITCTQKQKSDNGIKANDLRLRPLELSWWDCGSQPTTPKNPPSLAMVQDIHQNFTKAWKASIEYQKIRHFFSEVLLNMENLQVTSCMCLCLGSLTWNLGKPCNCQDCIGPMSQLVAFESLVELLSDSDPSMFQTVH